MQGACTGIICTCQTGMQAQPGLWAALGEANNSCAGQSCAEIRIHLGRDQSQIRICTNLKTCLPKRQELLQRLQPELRCAAIKEAEDAQTPRPSAGTASQALPPHHPRLQPCFQLFQKPGKLFPLPQPHGLVLVFVTICYLEQHQFGVF